MDHEPDVVSGLVGDEGGGGASTGLDVNSTFEYTDYELLHQSGIRSVFRLGSGGYPLTWVGTTPNSCHVLIVNGGAGYLVKFNPESQLEVERLPVYPVLDIIIDKSTDLLIMHDFTRMCSIGGSGVSWVTKRLSWDGIDNVRVESGKLVGDAWDASQNSVVKFCVDLNTGCVDGGASI